MLDWINNEAKSARKTCLVVVGLGIVTRHGVVFGVVFIEETERVVEVLRELRELRESRALKVLRVLKVSRVLGMKYWECEGTG